MEEACILASNLQRLIARENLTKTKLALIADISRPTINRIEKGHPNVKLSDIRKLADALDTTVIDLLTPQAL